MSLSVQLKYSIYVIVALSVHLFPRSGASHEQFPEKSCLFERAQVTLKVSSRRECVQPVPSFAMAKHVVETEGHVLPLLST